MAGLLALTPTGSFALELGEAAIRSSLGQSLVVEIPYRLAPSEQLAPDCVALAPAAGNRELPTYTRASRIGITATHIEIFGSARVLEPLIGITVDVHCATAPHFARSYQLFVDPPTRVPGVARDDVRTTAAAPPAAASTPALAPRATSDATPTAVAPPTARATVSARARGQVGGALAQGQTYTVVRGDTLSGIAARVADRPATIRAAADAIFAANPDAFARGDRNLLEAGRSIAIPLMATADAAAVPAPTPAPATAEAAVPTAAPAPTGESAPLAAPVSATPPPNVEPAASVGVADSIAPAPAAAPSLPASAPLPASPTLPAAASEPASAATDAPTSTWLTMLLAFGAALALATPLLFLRRRRPEAPQDDRPAPRVSQPRRLIDPAAGFDVVEGRLGRTQTNETLRPLAAAATSTARMLGPEAAPLDSDSTSTVDLDVGAPVDADARVDWFSDRTDAVTAISSADDESLDNDETTRMPPPESSTSAETLETKADVDQEPIDDEQHTLTIVEIDMLRQDYEAEHTLTQVSSKALQEAVADLKATQAARAAAGQTATLEMPARSTADGDDTTEAETLTQRRA